MSQRPLCPSRYLLQPVRLVDQMPARGDTRRDKVERMNYSSEQLLIFTGPRCSPVIPGPSMILYAESPGPLSTTHLPQQRKTSATQTRTVYAGVSNYSLVVGGVRLDRAVCCLMASSSPMLCKGSLMTPARLAHRGFHCSPFRLTSSLPSLVGCLGTSTYVVYIACWLIESH